MGGCGHPDLFLSWCHHPPSECYETGPGAHPAEGKVGGLQLRVSLDGHIWPPKSALDGAAIPHNRDSQERLARAGISAVSSNKVVISVALPPVATTCYVHSEKVNAWARAENQEAPLMSNAALLLRQRGHDAHDQDDH